MMIESLSSTAAVIGLILGFGFIIFVHELGHFLVAKAVGIKVTQFALGFGHSLLTFRKGLGFRIGATEAEYNRKLAAGADPSSLGETEYRLNWMPLGGYVKMVGQDDLDPTSTSTDPRSFSAKPIWARACVVSAGVVMNLIFGVIFFILAFSYGVQFPRAIVGGVDPESPASRALAVGHGEDPGYRGLRAGDRVIAIDGKPVDDFMDLAVNAALARRGSTLSVVVERHGHPEPLTFQITPEMSRHTRMLSLGVETPVLSQIAAIPVEGPLADELRQAGVERGMWIVKVDDAPVESFYDYHRLITEAKGLPVTLTLRNAVGRTAQLTRQAMPVLTQMGPSPAHLIGMTPATVAAALDPAGPAAKAGVQAGDVMVQVGDASWPQPDELIEQVRRAAESNEPVAVSVLRGDRRIDLSPITLGSKGKLGIYLEPALNEPIIAATLPGSPAAALNLVPGSRLTSINGAAVGNWTDIQRLLQLAVSTAGTQATVRIGYELNIVGRPTGESAVSLNADDIRQVASAAWEQPLPIPLFASDRMLIKSDGPLAAAALGFKKTHQFMIQTYQTLARLFQGSVRVEHLRGPIGIVYEGQRIAQQGWTYLMFFLGLISVNLVVINFLPMPIVDGGLMVFLIIEKLKGSPVSPRVLSTANLVGLVMLACLFLVVTYFDVIRLATNN